MAENQNSGFSSIFGSLKKMVFTDDYLDSGKPAEAETAKSTVSAIPANAGVPVVAGNAYSEEMVKKIHALLESLNKPGIDFFELWNATEAMGGVNPLNLQNAFTALRVLGLTKDTVITTGDAYCNELQSKLSADIQKKKDDKDAVVGAMNKERQQLQTTKLDLEAKIQALSNQLAEATTQLSQIDSKYAPQVQGIEDKIQAGTNGLNVVIGQIKNVLELVKSTIK